MLTFADEMISIVEAVENAKREAAERALHPTDDDRKRFLAQETEASKPGIITMLAQEPRRPWKATSKIANAIGVTNKRAAQMLCKIRKEGLVISRRNHETEWRLA